jgi:cytochrome c553
MKHLAISAILVVLAAHAAEAGPHIKTLADSCGICHGTDGIPPKDGLDRLAGMSRSEFIEEMSELKQDPREGRLMSVIARGYSNAEIRAMADYFSKLK